MTGRRAGAVGATALVARIAYALAFMRGYTPRSDADSYYRLARSVAAGHGFLLAIPFDRLHASAIRPPLYPAVASVAFRVFGSHVGAGQAVNIVAGSAAAVVGSLVAARVGGPRAGLFAGLVLALYPPLLANDTTLLAESFAVLLTFACVLMLLDGRTVIAGAFLGLLMLDRASAQWLVLVFGAWVLWKLGWKHALRFALVAVVVVAPWVIRNAVDVGGPVLVATNGFNLNAVYSSEAAHDNGFVDANFDPRFATARLDAANEVAFDDALQRHALSNLRSDPARLAHVVATNTLAWFELQPGRNHTPEVLDGRNLAVRGWTLPLFYLVTVAGIAGLVWARRRAAAQLLLLLAGYVTVVCVFSIAVPRLRSLFDAAMALGAGLALAHLSARDSAEPQPPDAAADDVPRRAAHLARTIAVVAIVAAVVGAGGLVWRSHMQTRARREITAAVADDAGAIGVLQRATVGAHDGPPRYGALDTARLDDLARALVGSSADAPPSIRAQVVATAKSVRVAAHAVDVIGLLSAGEYLHPAGSAPSSQAVEARYTANEQSMDATLPSWTVYMSGAPLERARADVASLAATLRGARSGN